MIYVLVLISYAVEINKGNDNTCDMNFCSDIFIEQYVNNNACMDNIRTSSKFAWNHWVRGAKPTTNCYRLPVHVRCLVRSQKQRDVSNFLGHSTSLAWVELADFVFSSTSSCHIKHHSSHSSLYQTRTDGIDTNSGSCQLIHPNSTCTLTQRSHFHQHNRTSTGNIYIVLNL